MEQTSVEDFQDYHNQQSVKDIDELPSVSAEPMEKLDHMEHSFEDDEASLSGSAHHSPDEVVFDRPSRTSSPRTSHGSDDEISLLESSYESLNQPSPCTPLKTRSRFRNPSSVRAMQMDTTPPHLVTPCSQQRRGLHTPSRHGTPRSTRSHRSVMSSPSKLSPTKKMKKEYPLILLHVTLLRMPLSYSPEILETVLPPSILANWKLLQEKATDTVLERGILIPHPREDYDLLEERLLESLELKIPRILKCGHFHLSPEEADVVAESDSEAETDANDADICLDCGRRVRDGKFGSAGTGSKRWDIKLFAANGLMRAGAWSAAWREMERVDVEILPWMEEDMKRELELRREEDERARAEEAHAQREEGVAGLDEARLREIYGHDAQAFVDGLGDEMPADASTHQRTPGEMPIRGKEIVPLWDLLRDYIYHAAQDRRNLTILFLSIVVLFLSMGSFTSNRGSSEIMIDRAPIAQTSSLSTDAPPKPSTSAVTGTSSASPAPLEPQEHEEPDPSTSWTETAEDVTREMLED